MGLPTRRRHAPRQVLRSHRRPHHDPRPLLLANQHRSPTARSRPSSPFCDLRLSSLMAQTPITVLLVPRRRLRRLAFRGARDGIPARRKWGQGRGDDGGGARWRLRFALPRGRAVEVLELHASASVLAILKGVAPAAGKGGYRY